MGRWSDPDDDSSTVLFPCLNYASVICDTHSEEDNWKELKEALKLVEDGEKGYGIVSGAALKVYADSHVEAMGGPVHQFVRRKGKIIRATDISPVI